jgi:hypothetical protein
MAVFWDFVLFSLIQITDVSEVLSAPIIRAMMEAVSTSKPLVNIYQITQCNIPVNSHLHTRRRENLKSCLKLGHERFLPYPFRLILCTLIILSFIASY